MNTFKKTIAVALLTTFVMSAQAQPSPRMDAKTLKWGYGEYGQPLAVPAIYEDADYFYEGMAAVKRNGKWGFIDQTGKETVAPQFDQISERFSEGLVAVRQSNQWGYIDYNGKEAIPFQFDDAKPFTEGLAAVALYEHGEAKWGYIDHSGKTVIPRQYQLVGPFLEGLAAVNPDGMEWGFINHEGKMVIPAAKLHVGETYYMGMGFYQGHFRATDAQNGDTTHMYSNGQISKSLLPIRYPYLDESNGKKAYKSGSSGKYDIARNFTDGFAAVNIGAQEDEWGELSGGKWGFIDRSGEETIPLQYDDIAGGFFSEGLAAVAQFDEQGTKKWGYIDQRGKTVIPFLFDKVLPFSEGLAAVAQFNEQGIDEWGYIDRSGKVIIPFGYMYAMPFSEGVAAVLADVVQWTFIDRSGKPTLSQTYVEIGEYHDYDNPIYLDFVFYNGLIKVTPPYDDYEIREFYIDKNGNEIK